MHFLPAFHYTTRGPWICHARVAESRSPSSFGMPGIFFSDRSLPSERCCPYAFSLAACSAGTGRRQAPSRKALPNGSLTRTARVRSCRAGTPDGLFRIVYRFANEQLDEVANRTVHAGALSALVEAAAGYRFYLAVYVREVGPFTPLYMAAIDPFRKLIVYPALLRGVSAQWSATFGADMTT